MKRNELLFFAGESSDLIEAELQMGRRARLAARGLWLTAEQFSDRHVQGFGGALDEIERRVAGSAFVVVDHLARGVEQIGELRLRQALAASERSPRSSCIWKKRAASSRVKPARFVCSSRLVPAVNWMTMTSCVS